MQLTGIPEVLSGVAPEQVTRQDVETHMRELIAYSPCYAVIILFWVMLMMSVFRT